MISPLTEAEARQFFIDRGVNLLELEAQGLLHIAYIYISGQGFRACPPEDVPADAAIITDGEALIITLRSDNYLDGVPTRFAMVNTEFGPNARLIL